ncbi:MAG TPA: cupin domain-containing protein [Thermomicrobiales bacterium]|nr:cupin domain-containing protein [Thermomicrobiales bacterium]
MTRPPRRVVTGHTADGHSTIVSDGPAPSRIDLDGIAINEQWIIDSSPPPLDELVNRSDERDFSLEPLPGGIKCSLVRLESGLPPSRSRMHETSTLDFVVVVSGEITLLMEDGETTLYPGDSVIERGTNHAWANRGSGPRVIAATMISTRT